MLFFNYRTQLEHAVILLEGYGKIQTSFSSSWILTTPGKPLFNNWNKLSMQYLTFFSSARQTASAGTCVNLMYISVRFQESFEQVI